MSIATEISRLQTAKSNLKTSIENKGVTVPSATTLDGYAALVDQISGGGITTTEVANATGTTLVITSGGDGGDGGGATEYVCPSRSLAGGETCFFLSDIGLSASDFLNDSHTIMWVEWTDDQLALVWLDSMDDDDFFITIPSGTKAVCSSCSNGIATFAFCGLDNNAYGFFTLQAEDYAYDSLTDSTSRASAFDSSGNSPLESAAVQSATYGNRNNGYLDTNWIFGNTSLHILKF